MHARTHCARTHLVGLAVRRGRFAVADDRPVNPDGPARAHDPRKLKKLSLAKNHFSNRPFYSWEQRLLVKQFEHHAGRPKSIGLRRSACARGWGRTSAGLHGRCSRLSARPTTPPAADCTIQSTNRVRHSARERSATTGTRDSAHVDLAVTAVTAVTAATAVIQPLSSRYSRYSCHSCYSRYIAVTRHVRRAPPVLRASTARQGTSKYCAWVRQGTSEYCV
jgi:hypothetical protein